MKTALLASAVMYLTSTLVSATAAEPAPASRLQRFIAQTRCYASLPRVAHRPNFSIQPAAYDAHPGKFFWLLDGAQRIGVLNLAWGELELLRFFPPAGAPVTYEMPAVYHWATLRGARLTIVPQGGWTGKGELARVQASGEQLRLRYTEKLGDRSQFIHEFNLRFDPLLGYVLDCAIKLDLDAPRDFEYANLLAGGLSESRADHKRYQKCLWTRRDGQFCYLYQNPRSLMHNEGAEWTELPADNGFVGWVAERDMNPFLEVLASSPGTRLVTCSAWYDQHFIARAPEAKGADGLYRTTAAYRVLSLPLAVAKELEDAARTMLPAPAAEGPLGFLQGVGNDFETGIPAGTLYNGCMWGHAAHLDTETGHSGKRSIRLGANQSAQPIHGGTAIYVETGKRYRLSGWVRTRGVTGKGACLRVNEVFFNWEDVRATHRSPALTGDHEWTRLEVEFSPVAGDPFAVPGLVVEGEGTAWFDDLELRELAP